MDAFRKVTINFDLARTLQWIREDASALFDKDQQVRSERTLAMLTLVVDECGMLDHLNPEVGGQSSYEQCRSALGTYLDGTKFDEFSCVVSSTILKSDLLPTQSVSQRPLWYAPITRLTSEQWIEELLRTCPGLTDSQNELARKLLPATGGIARLAEELVSQCTAVGSKSLEATKRITKDELNELANWLSIR